MADQPARIITFYSYKGGTGRSMALANIAWILASNAKRVLVVDWDLEAPGLQRYFRPFLVDRDLVSSPGVVDLITAFVLEAITPLERNQTLPKDWFVPLTDIDPYIISLDWKFPKGGTIDFIPAGRQGPDYAMRFAAIKWQKFYDVLGGGAFIEELKLRMRTGYDYVLVDSRTGVSDTSGTCTIQMPDSLVCCFTFNNQSIDGAAAITKDVFERRHIQNSLVLNPPLNPSRYAHPYRFRVFPVPMRVDQAEKEKLELRQSYARWKFDAFLDRIPPTERRSYWNSVEVPYVPFFAYEEILSPFKEEPSDPKSTLAAYTRIAAEITLGEVQSFKSLASPEDNRRVLQEFASLPTALFASSQSENGNTRAGVASRSSDINTLPSAESDIETAVRQADTILQSFDTNQRDLARLMWMRLVRVPAPGENTLNSKVRVQVQDLPQEATNVTNAYAKAGLLTIDRNVEGGETTVEATNEALLRSWPTLNEWIKADRDLMVWRQDLQTSRARWVEQNRQPSYLLTGRQLFEANQWLLTHPSYFSDRELEYMKESQRGVASEQRRTRIKLAFGIAAVLLVLIAIPIFFYLSNKISSRSNEAIEIATAAQQKIDGVGPDNVASVDHLQLGILLALESRRMAPNDRADTILKATLPLLPRKLSDVNPGRPVLAVALNQDNTRLLVVTGRAVNNQNSAEDRAMQVYDDASGSIQGFVQFKPGSRSFEVSPDGRFVAVVSLEKNIYSISVIDPASGQIVGTINHRGSVYDMAFSPDGWYFASASGDGKVAFLDLTATASPSNPLLLNYPGPVNTVAFSGDSRHLAVAGEDFQVQVWEITPGKPSWPKAKRFQMSGTVVVMALSHGGEYLATMTINDVFIDVWDVQSGMQIRSFANKPGSVNTFSFTADNRYLLAAGSGQSLSVWKLDGTIPEPALRAFGNVSLLSVSRDRKYFGAVASNALAALWQYDGSFQAAGVLIPQSNLTNLEFAAQNRVVTADVDNVIRIWQISTEIGTDFSSEACSRLTRNLTAEEWATHLASYLGAYRRTCSDLP